MQTILEIALLLFVLTACRSTVVLFFLENNESKKDFIS